MTSRNIPQGIAVITGAAGGMGSACARQLAEAGWDRLLLCDISEERLEAVAAPLRAAGKAVDILAGDIADLAFPARVVAALEGQPIAALVHTAGISPLQGDALRIIEVNLVATVRLVDAVRSHMAPGAAAILFASNSSYFPMPPEAAAAFSAPLPPQGAEALLPFAPKPEMAYPLSKLGVRALVKREAKAFGTGGARIASMSPGAIDTPMTQGAQFEMVQRMVDASASGRMGQPDELAAVVTFMCSPAASFVTAADWLVDGGHTAGMGF